jgi:FtsP/CotA-like multicopper oxidase with cupredoxin domain
VFEFERRKGAWQINHQFFDENFANAIPKLGTMERWILKNGGGGWWHPIHVHLESHQLVKIEGRKPPRFQQNLVDTTMLGPGSEAEILIKFRTFQGPFVFHCHTIEHEDMRMMFVVDPRVEGPSSNEPITRVFP